MYLKMFRKYVEKSWVRTILHVLRGTREVHLYNSIDSILLASSIGSRAAKLVSRSKYCQR